MAGTVVVDTVKSSTTGAPVFQNTNGTEIGQLARAWVNFNGATGASRASFNVTSVTRVSTGDYTVNFTTSMADANYSVVATSGGQVTTDRTILASAYSLATSSVKVNAAISTNAAYYDPALFTVAVFR